MNRPGNQHGSTTLWDAAMNGQLQTVKRLIANGADVNAADDTNYGCTPLYMSSGFGRTAIVEFLLRKGADANATIINGETALLIAACRGHTDVVSLLLRYGADVNLRKNDGCTAFYAAVQEGHQQIIRRLIKHGANINGRARMGGTPLTIASEVGNIDVVKTLINEGASVNASTIEGCTSLYFASRHGHMNVVEILITNGANVNAATNNRYTSLIIAAEKGHLNVVQKLIQEGAKVNASSKCGATALLIAAYNGRLEMVKYLVDQAGIDLLYMNNQGCTAVMWASRNGHRAIVEYLVNKIKNRGKYSGSSSSSGVNHDLLMAAAGKGRLATIQQLVTSLGADPNHRDLRTGLTAEDMAHMEGHHDVAWFLNKPTEGINRQSRKRPEMVPCKDNYGRSTLREMQNKHRDSYLIDDNLDAGIFDLHFQDENGMTLLHAAVKKNHPEKIARLLERGALATALTYDGVTPLDLARREKAGIPEGYIFIQKVIDYKPKDENGMTYDEVTPLDLARREETGIAEAYIQIHLQKFIDCKLKSSSEKCRYYTVMLSLILECLSISARYKDDDPKAEKERQEVLKKVSWLLSLGVPLEPPGNYHTHALHLAITSNCKPILTLFLAAGAHLYATHNGLGPVEVAWLTPDVTTWIGVTVTRAVMNKLRSEVKGFSICTVTDWILILGVKDLLLQLDGENPWRAKFSMPDKYLNALLGAACEQGATLIAWWVWRAGGCCLFQQKKDGKTPLHLALDGKHHQTAVALIQYMEANAFLQDNDGRLPIDLFPERERNYLLKDALVREYRFLDGALQRTIDSKQKREAKEVILLLLTLFLVWNNDQYKSKDENNWKKFYISLISLLSSSDDVHNTQNWIQILNEKLKEILPGVQCKRKEQNGNEEEIREYFSAHNMITGEVKTGENREAISHFLHEINTCYYTDDESDSLTILIDLLEHAVENFIASGQTLSSLSGKASRKISERDINVHLKKGLKMCSWMKLPLFLHLLVSKAKINPRIIIEPITKTTVLHLAAVNGNMSAVLFLLKNGASVSQQDINGHIPSHFSYMHGHKDLGGLLNTHPEIASRIGLKPTDMWQAYKKYLNLYGLDLGEISNPRFIECNNPEELIQLHLKSLKERWLKRGIREVVKEAKVNYTSGESLAVNDAIKLLLGKLILEVGCMDSRFEGNLVFVGSSADDVRLLTPDEYDCNVVFKKFSGYPDGGCQIHLQNPLTDSTLHTYKDISINVLTERKDLKDLFEERNLLLTFYSLIKKCLPKLSIDDPRLSLTLPSVKLTQVGVGLSFAWNGKEFPLLLIDVDVVPTMKAPWPPGLEKTRLLPDAMEVYLNTVGSNEWRFSSAQDETRVMENLSEDEKFVFLACKLAIASLKTEGWMPHQVKDQFKYWDGQKLKIPLPKGFLLKNAFFFEKEEVTEPSQWKEDKFLERMHSIFKRMCVEFERDNRTTFVPGKVSAYFGRSTEQPGVGYGAPEILAFVQDWQKSPSLHDSTDSRYSTSDRLFERDNRTTFVPGKVSAYFGRSTEQPGVGYGAPEILAFVQDWQKSPSLHDRSVRPKTSAKKI